MFVSWCTIVVLFVYHSYHLCVVCHSCVYLSWCTIVVLFVYHSYHLCVVCHSCVYLSWCTIVVLFVYHSYHLCVVCHSCVYLSWCTIVVFFVFYRSLLCVMCHKCPSCWVPKVCCVRVCAGVRMATRVPIVNSVCRREPSVASTPVKTMAPVCKS